VKLAAHGETVTLRNPVTIKARSNAFEIIVTLPVKSYVERVVASESTGADTMESLKALAIVVRMFAMHEAHGHTDYDLCDSTHRQFLRWGWRVNAAPRRMRPHCKRRATPFGSTGSALWPISARTAAGGLLHRMKSGPMREQFRTWYRGPIPIACAMGDGSGLPRLRGRI
jgi:hypothetical protein